MGLRRRQVLEQEGTWLVKGTSRSAGLPVIGDGTGVVAQARGVAVRILADRTGLTGELSVATARPGFVAGHDRGQVHAGRCRHDDRRRR